MYIKKILSSWLLIFISASLSFSSPTASASNNIQELVKAEVEKEQIEAHSYEFTKALCIQESGFIKEVEQQLRLEWERKKIEFTGVKASLWTLSPLDMFKPTRSTQVLLKSPGYHQALNECFGSNRILKFAFTVNLAEADFEGHLGAVAGLIATGAVSKAVQATAWAMKFAIGFKVVQSITYSMASLGLINLTIDTIRDLYSNYRLTDPTRFGTAIEKAGNGALTSQYALLQKRIDELNKQLIDSSNLPLEKASELRQKRDNLIQFKRRLVVY